MSLFTRLKRLDEVTGLDKLAGLGARREAKRPWWGSLLFGAALIVTSAYLGGFRDWPVFGFMIVGIVMVFLAGFDYRERLLQRRATRQGKLPSSGNTRSATKPG